jgi:TonB family protein
MLQRPFRRATWLGAIVIAPLVCAFAATPNIAGAAHQQPQSPPPAQQAPAPLSANQPPQTVGPISSPEIDAIAADLAPLIAKEHLSTVAVFGALGPMDRITPMGLPIGDSLSAALANRAQGFTVIDRAILRATLKQQRVAEKMLSSDVLAYWISSMVKANCIAIVKLENFNPPNVTIAVYLYDPRKSGSNSFANRKVVIQLDSSQAEAIRTVVETPIKKEPDIPTAVTAAGANGISMPTCEYCPRPDYSQAAREAKQEGEIWLHVMVTEEGRATEIEVTRPLGYGMDAMAVEAIQKWQFKPSTDSNGKPVSALTVVMVQFQLFNSPAGSKGKTKSNVSDNPTRLDIVPFNGSNPSATPSQNALPICIHCPRPEYSKEAKKKKIEGTVSLEAVVTPAGDVANVKVTKSLGYGLDEEAIKAVKKWRFRPTIGPDGKAVEVNANVQVEFKLF